MVVIGGGQSGLSVGYHLAKRGLRFVILDANERVGDSWRQRWDSLRLFTPARYSSLDGHAVPGRALRLPDQGRDGRLPGGLRRSDSGCRCAAARASSRLSRSDDGTYRVEAGDRVYETDHVVVAMGSYQRKKVPPFAPQLAPSIVQIHSQDYRNPSQLQGGDVLLVGAGNSAAEIAKELAPTHRVLLSGRDVGQIPFRIGGFWGRLILVRLVLRLVFHRVLTIRTPIGRKLRPKVLHAGGPLIRVRSRELAALGVERVPRVTGVRDGKPLLEDGRALEVANVVWCTGFHPGFTWIDLPIWDELGDPVTWAASSRASPASTSSASTSCTRSPPA